MWTDEARSWPSPPAVAAPDHVEAVRHLFIDRLTPAQLEALTAIAETVLAGLDERRAPAVCG